MLFIAWTVIVLLNTVIAHVAALYPHTSVQAEQLWLLLKCKTIQQHMLVHESRPWPCSPRR